MIDLQIVAMQVLWVLLLPATLAGVVRSRFWRWVPGRELAVLTACVGLGLWLRMRVEGFPGDIRLTWDQVGFGGHWWAAGFSAWLRILFTLFPESFDTIRLAHVVLGALTPLAGYAFVVAYWRDRTAALATAALLAFSPHMVRFSASDAAHVPLTFALMMAAAAAAVWARRGGIWWMLLAAGWLSLCPNLRKESLVFLPIALLVAVASGAKPSRRACIEFGIGAALLALLTIQPTIFLLGEPRPTDGVNLVALHMNPVFASEYYPLATKLLVIIGILLFIGEPALRHRGFAWLGSAFLLGLGTYFLPDPSKNMLMRHALPLSAALMVFGGLGAAALVRHLARRSAWGRFLVRAEPDDLDPSPSPSLSGPGALLLPLVLLLAFLPGRGILTQEWTHQAEFAFVRAHLSSIEDGCVIVFHEDAGSNDQGLRISPAVSRETGRRHHWVDTARFLNEGDATGCAVFYLSGSCHAKDYRSRGAPWKTYPPCAEFMRRAELEPIAEAHLPASSFTGERYTVSPVPVGFYRITAVLEDDPPKPGRARRSRTRSSE